MTKKWMVITFYHWSCLVSNFNICENWISVCSVYQHNRSSQLSSYRRSTRTSTDPLWTLWLGWRSPVCQQTMPARRHITLTTMVSVTHFFHTQNTLSANVSKHLKKINLHTGDLHQLNDNPSLQGSTPCGMRASSLTSTSQNWPWCNLWRRTMTQHPRMISSGSTLYRSPAYKTVNGFLILPCTWMITWHTGVSSDSSKLTSRLHWMKYEGVQIVLN